MAGGTEVLREYLVSLGFQVNANQNRTFTKTLDGVDKRMGNIAAAAASGAVAVAGMVTAFAYQMEKLYYASRRTGATAENLQAVEFGARQIGLGAGVMTNAIGKMAMSLKMQPGLRQMLQSFGVEVKGRDMSDVARDTVRELSKMPFYIGARIAGMFGLDPDTFLQMSQNQKEMDAAFEKRKQMNAEMGVDATKAAEAGKEYANTLREITERVKVLGSAIAIELLPFMKRFADGTNDLLKATSQTIAAKTGMGRLHGLVGMLNSVGLTSGASEESNSGGGLTAKSSYWDFTKKFWGAVGPAAAGAARNYGHTPGSPLPGMQGVVGGGGGGNRQGMTDAQIAELFDGLEQQYGLPKGTLDSLWDQESSRGRNMRSPTGVVGHFQITGPNRKRLGLDDPNNLSQGADAAAMMMSELLQQYGGRMPNALAAWNGGTAAGRNLALGSQETQNFVPSVMRKIEQHNTITVNGASDALGAAHAVGAAIDSSNAKLLSDMSGKHQ